MALRNIRVLGEYGEDSLRKACKEVKTVNKRILDLIEDMLDTMYDAQGVGLAAPQVGVLRRVVVIDIGEGPWILINPKILETDGEQREYEGCLSLPGKSAYVKRPMNVKFSYFDENMDEYEAEATGLMARAVCHELDHLDGVCYVDKLDGPLMNNEDIFPDEEDEVEEVEANEEVTQEENEE